MKSVRFSVIVPTCGRPSLIHTLKSIVAARPAPEDEVIVAGDGSQPDSRAICEQLLSLFDCHLRYIETLKRTACWGNEQRRLAITVARGTHLSFMDDDDAYVPGALASMRAGIRKLPRGPVLFQMRFDNGTVLWRERRLTAGNVGSPMIVVPNDRGRLGSWGTKLEGDYHFVKETAEKCGGEESISWVKEVVAEIRPVSP